MLHFRQVTRHGVAMGRVADHATRVTTVEDGGNVVGAVSGVAEQMRQLDVQDSREAVVSATVGFLRARAGPKVHRH
ncbi:hypothetical protein CSUB01_12025 [Colletotrichum sublineola]|uniref:Uncharacterized protein n=1 Tax=Colletotrichum sublineola TaxID=1173701 RepID=A0A066XFC8_COLSU|nr:hypothetical protein CSUB01_12025 [Colletotrichum sublineola]